MTPNKSRKPFGQFCAVAIVVVVGLASRKIPGLFPAFLGKCPGDALWALMVFFLWGIVLPMASTMRVAILALAVSFGVEFSQLYHAPWIDAIRSTTIGHLALGSAFYWLDLAAYTAGVLLGVLIEWLTGWRPSNC